MSKEWRNGLIGFAVAFVFCMLLAVSGAPLSTAYVAPIGFGVAIWFILSQLSNNRSVKNVRDADRNELLAAPPPAGAGLVYVYREGFVGKAVGFDVAFDGTIVAQLKSPRFTRLVALPGQHTLAAGPKSVTGLQPKAVATSFVIAAGEVIVYALHMQMGMVQNAVTVQRELSPEAAMGRLRTMTMVAPDLSALPAHPGAPPPPPTAARA